MHIRLPKLAEDRSRFKAIIDKYHLQIRGINGEHSQSKEAIFDISNRRRLGVNEVQAVQDIIDGVEALIQMEKKLEG